MPGTSDLKQSDQVIGKIGAAVPVIDARTLLRGSAAEQQKLLDTVRSACLRTGFFYLDHVFDGNTILEDALQQMRTFFAMQDDDPRKQAVNNQNKAGSYGWMPLYGEPSYQPGTVAHVESFDCGLEYGQGEKQLEGANAWPPIDGFRRDIIAYWEHISKTGNAVLKLVSQAAGLAEDYLPSICNSQQLNTMRLLHYPANDQPATDRNVGIAAHTDFECITLILQTSPGLELTDVSGSWYDAPGHDGRVVVLLDDMLERLTNGMFKATGHRVRNTQQERFSIVMFFAVNDDVLVEPLPQFVSDTRRSAYAPVKQRKHIDVEIERAEKNRAAEKTD